MDRTTLISNIRNRRSYLCVGLDTDLEKLPPHLLQESDPIFAFNKAIIDATKPYCVAYKPNVAFYEAYGSRGWDSLEKTVAYIGDSHFIIADAKRGDIGNTSARYAQAFFGAMHCDAVTVAPYMGEDSVTPFFSFHDKWVVLLALTSNKGSSDFQLIKDGDGPLYAHVIRKASTWGNPENIMFVVGATHPEYFSAIRALVPEHFLLVPGVGAQGGDLHAVSASGFNREIGLLVNSTRDIIYASGGYDFAEQAAARAHAIQQDMEMLLLAHNLI